MFILIFFIKKNFCLQIDTTSSEMIEQQLRSIGIFTTEQLNTLITIWKNTHCRVYAFFRLSAFSYFKYLQLSQFKEVSLSLFLTYVNFNLSVENVTVFE